MVEPVDTDMLDTQKRNWLLAGIIVCLWTSSDCEAAWFDSAWQYRRPISFTWDDEHPSGEDLACVVFYTDGHTLPNGEDVRVATEDGRLVASHVLMLGPGDRIRVVFSLVKGARDYEIYLGNPHPSPPPAGMEDVHYKTALLLETRQWTGGAVNNFNQLEESWSRSKPVLGKMMIDGVFLGFNPFGPQEQWISKFNGSLFAPMDGDYMFAISAHDEAGLYIDGQQTVFAPNGPSDTRYHASVHLNRGRHDLMVYHVNKGGNGYVSLGWKMPDTSKYQIINRTSFGICYSGIVGLMEQHGKTLVADFSANQIGECFVSDTYCFHYHFSTQGKAPSVANKFEWDFGDGQFSTEPEVDHVYLNDGIYTVKLIARNGENSDTQTCQLAVSRNYAHILDAKEEPAAGLSTIVEGYDINSMQAESLGRALQLHLAADRLDAAVAIANRTAGLKSHLDKDVVIAALNTLQKKLTDAGKPEKAIEVLDRVPVDSDLQPAAARLEANLCLWWTGDFAKAVKLLSPYQERADVPTKRMYAQALLLTGKADEGRKILDAMPAEVPPNRRAALSGAAARSVEFFITEKDAESGEEAWDRWQARFPSDFLEGYSVVLRTKLMELRNRPEPAAKLAEAFATAQPLSSYAPQLLDAASKLLAATDPTKSQALRQLLKQKYPEDPLSQN
jgi:PKD repeat protein